MWGSAIYYDVKSGGAISEAVAIDNSMGIFTMFQNMNVGFLTSILTLLATILVGTYYI